VLGWGGSGAAVLRGRASMAGFEGHAQFSWPRGTSGIVDLYEQHRDEVCERGWWLR
jgi:hypothetical protein